MESGSKGNSSSPWNMVGTMTLFQFVSISRRMSGLAIAAALLIASSTMISELR